MSEFLSLFVVVMFTPVAVIFLIEVLDGVFRRRPASGTFWPAVSFKAGFSLRRPDSLLRERYHRRARPESRLCEPNEPQEDPYDP